MDIHIYRSIYTSVKIFTDCLIYCILSNGEVIKYHKFISVVVIELSVRCLNTGPEDRLSMRQFRCVPTTYVTEIKKAYFEIYTKQD